MDEAAQTTRAHLHFIPHNSDADLFNINNVYHGEGFQGVCNVGGVVFNAAYQWIINENEKLRYV